MEHVIGDAFGFLKGVWSFLEVVAICITALIGLLLVLMAIPRSPIRDFVFGLTQRVGVTATALALAPPMDAIPITGELYDIAAIIGIAYYWYTFAQKYHRQVGRIE